METRDRTNATALRMIRTTPAAFVVGAAAIGSSLCLPSVRADVIYQETFTGQTAKGYTGPESNPTVDTAGVMWTIDISGGNFTASSDWFRVADVDGDERFEAHDVGGPVDWFSPTIDISSYTGLDVSALVDASDSGFNVTSSDVFQIFYSVDNGPEVMFYDAQTDEPWPANGQPNDETVSSGIIAGGSTLNIRVHIDTRSGVKSLYFDDITVSGTFVPEPATCTLIVAGLGLIGYRRR